MPRNFWVHKLHPFAHPIVGLTKCNILHFARDMAHSTRLTIVVQDLVDYNFAWFLKIHQSHEDVFSS
jgi:hypothetical protein